MSRVKISEYKAKSILFSRLGLSYAGLAIDTSQSNWEKNLEKLNKDECYVVKVDQGVKKRGKSGLIKLNIGFKDLVDTIKDLESKGYNVFLIESFFMHNQSSEHYLALQRVRDGIRVMYHAQGGVDIEQNTKDVAIEEYLVDDEAKIMQVAKATMIPFDIFNRLIDTFNKEFFAFMEVNPFVISNGTISILDLAVEVDSAGDYFVTSWKKSDFVQKKATMSEELAVARLSEKSPSSFKLEVLNKDGSIWMLLSGGGASLVIADEYDNVNKGTSIGNYGEYSGAPNTDETYEYAKQIVSLMLKSAAEKKILLIAGGVANFTDVSVTFRGVLRALEECADEIKKQNIAIFVRRGGPQQEKGLQLLRDFVAQHSLSGFIAGPELSLDEIVNKSLKAL